jgi:cephalosporin-C deacetylase-like acetyl esterase
VAGKKEVSFDVKGTPISAWLYLPDNVSTPVPAIVMGNGAAGTKEMFLENYAVRFREAGFAVLAFDYRYWGDSGGEPRQLIWIPDQLEDYAAAVAYVRSFREVDPARVSLWGTSFSGGHVITTAAKDSRIACAIAQVPFLDGMAAFEMPHEGDTLGLSLRTLVHAQRDLARSWLGLSPHTIPIVGKTGSIAMMPDSEAYEAFAMYAPEGYANETPARIMIRADKYRPVRLASQVQCPVLFQIADRDTFVPNSAVEEAANLLGDSAVVRHYPIGHFDIYVGENFEASVSDQLEFLQACGGRETGEAQE